MSHKIKIINVQKFKIKTIKCKHVKNITNQIIKVETKIYYRYSLQSKKSIDLSINFFPSNYNNININIIYI